MGAPNILPTNLGMLFFWLCTRVTREQSREPRPTHAAARSCMPGGTICSQAWLTLLDNVRSGRPLVHSDWSSGEFPVVRAGGPAGGAADQWALGGGARGRQRTIRSDRREPSPFRSRRWRALAAVARRLGSNAPRRAGPMATAHQGGHGCRGALLRVSPVPRLRSAAAFQSVDQTAATHSDPRPPLAVGSGAARFAIALIR